MKRTVVTKLYKEITSILLETGEIDVIPPLKETKNKRVYGYIKRKVCKNAVTNWVESTEYVGIYINHSAFCNYKDEYLSASYAEYKRLFGEFLELINTICHEYAHIKFNRHDHNHKALTEYYINLYIKWAKGKYFIEGTKYKGYSFRMDLFLKDVKDRK